MENIRVNTINLSAVLNVEKVITSNAHEKIKARLTSSHFGLKTT